MKHNTNSGVLSAIFAAFFMGTMGIFSRKSGLDAEVVTFFRLFFGAIFLTIFLMASGKKGTIASTPSWLVVINGFMLAGLIVFYTLAMEYTTLANAVMILYLAPLVASIFAHFFLQEKLGLTGVLLIGTALLGFGMMMEFNIDFATSDGQLIGLGFGLLSMFCYTGFIIINRITSDDIHIYTRSFYQMLVGAACLLPILLFHIPTISSTQWVWLVGAGFFPGFLGILLAVTAIKYLSTATFCTLSYLEPISVVIYGWILFNEPLSALQFSGCGLIVASSVIKAWLARE